MTRANQQRIGPHFGPDEHWKRELVAAVAQRLPAEPTEPTDLDMPPEQLRVPVEQDIADFTPQAVEQRRSVNLPRLVTETMTQQMDVLIAEVEKVKKLAQEKHEQSQRTLDDYIEQIRAEGLAAVDIANKQVTATEARIEEYRQRTAKTNGAAS